LKARQKSVKNQVRKTKRYVRRRSNKKKLQKGRRGRAGDDRKILKEGGGIAEGAKTAGMTCEKGELEKPEEEKQKSKGGNTGKTSQKKRLDRQGGVERATLGNFEATRIKEGQQRRQVTQMHEKEQENRCDEPQLNKRDGRREKTAM